MHTYYNSTTVQKADFFSQNYDPVPCIHVEATHKIAIALPHGNFTMIPTEQKTHSSKNPVGSTAHKK